MRSIRALGLAALSLSVGGAAHAITIEVETPADAGVGSLREAIEQANALPGSDTIRFRQLLAGSVIRPATPLPALTDAETTIRGDLDGDGVPDIRLDGINVTSGYGLTVSANDCQIYGLSITRFPWGGILLNGTGGSRVRGCWLGLNLQGEARDNAALGTANLEVRDGHDNVIGGTLSTQRNLFSAVDLDNSRQIGLLILNAQRTTVQGNWFGLDPSGLNTLGAGDTGLRLQGWSGPGFDCSDNLIGGTASGAGNVFAGLNTGVHLTGPVHGNRLLGNRFGTDGSGLRPRILNYQAILAEMEAFENNIGGAAVGAGNVFLGGPTGVTLQDAGTANTVIEGNYFGCSPAPEWANKAGRFPITGISIGNGAGPVTIGGASPLATNFFGTSTDSPGAIGINASNMTEPLSILNNRFGSLPSGAYVPQRLPIALSAGSCAAVTLRDNRIRAANGLLFWGDTNGTVLRNTFRCLDWSLRILDPARGFLGNRTNADPTDDGGNRFYLPSTAPNFRWLQNLTPNPCRAEGNRWGDYSLTSEIEPFIDHFPDDASWGRVDYSPFIKGPGAQGEVGPALALTGLTALPGRAGSAILFTLSAPGQVTVEVLNLAGRTVAAPLQAAPRTAGAQQVLWSGLTSAGAAAPGGRYLVRVTARSSAGEQTSAVAPLNR